MNSNSNIYYFLPVALCSLLVGCSNSNSGSKTSGDPKVQTEMKGTFVAERTVSREEADAFFEFESGSVRRVELQAGSVSKSIEFTSDQLNIGTTTINEVEIVENSPEKKTTKTTLNRSESTGYELKNQVTVESKVITPQATPAEKTTTETVDKGIEKGTPFDPKTAKDIETCRVVRGSQLAQKTYEIGTFTFAEGGGSRRGIRTTYSYPVRLGCGSKEVLYSNAEPTIEKRGTTRGLSVRILDPIDSYPRYSYIQSQVLDEKGQILKIRYSEILKDVQVIK